MCWREKTQADKEEESVPSGKLRLLCGTHQGRKLEEMVSQKRVGFYVAVYQPQTKHHIRRLQSSRLEAGQGLEELGWAGSRGQC